MSSKKLTDTERALLIAGAGMTGRMLAWRKVALISLALNLLLVASYWYGQ